MESRKADQRENGYEESDKSGREEAGINGAVSPVWMKRKAGQGNVSGN